MNEETFNLFSTFIHFKSISTQRQSNIFEIFESKSFMRYLIKKKVCELLSHFMNVHNLYKFS